MALHGGVLHIVGSDLADYALVTQSAGRIRVETSLLRGTPFFAASSGDGNDRLIGGRGRDLFIGGFGADALAGMAGDDILIAGGTDHDGDLAALDAIMAEWTRTDRNYRQRIQALQDGVGPGGAVALNATTVFGDDQRDQLWGGSGSDWFLLDRRHPTLAARDLALDVAAFEAVLGIRPRE